MHVTINKMFTIILLQTLYFILKPQFIVTGYTATTLSIYGIRNSITSKGVRKRFTFLSSPSITAYRTEGQEKNRATQTPIPRPIRIILVRHGESLGNVDESAYVTTPDWRIPLTDRGHEQASETGKELKRIIGNDDGVFFYYSPYRRTRETVKEIEKHLHPKQIISMREEPRISEQQFGNFQNVEQVWESKRERHKFGRFYYRFRSGEAGLDVYSRVSSFIATLVRDCQQYQKAGYDLDKINVVIVTHGLSLRLFLMRWFQVSALVLKSS